MTSCTRLMRIAVPLLVLGPAPVLAQGGYDLFRQALLQEKSYGALERAAELYEQIVSGFPEDPGLTATALVRLGGIYETLGMPDARRIYLQVVREYPDQNMQIRVAREGLTRLPTAGAGRNASPATDPTYTLVFDDMPIGRLGSPASYDFSPDGTRVVFRSHARGERSPGLYVADRTGMIVRPLLLIDAVAGPTEGMWTPRWSPDGTRIAFMARFPDRGLAMGVYVIDPDGGAVERIGEALGGDLAWTPDGSAVALVGPGMGRLVKLDVTGSPMEEGLGGRLPQSTLVGGYSPDGRWLALDIRTERLGREMRDVWVATADGAERFYVTDAPGLDANPAWGTDGSLYFVSDRSGNANVWRLGIDDVIGMRYQPSRLRSDPRPGRGWQSRMEAGPYAQAEQVTFFQGERAAYLRPLTRGGVAFVMERVTSAVQLGAAVPPHVPRTIVRGRNPQFAAGGDRVVFETDAAGRGEIWVMSTDGAGPVKLAEGLTSTGRWPAFHVSPDGARVAYAADTPEGRAIFVVPVSGGDRRRVAALPGGEISHPVWSPDGTRIAFASGRVLFVAIPAGGTPTGLAELRSWDAWSVRWSPDGKHVAALGWGEPSGAVEPPNHVYVVPTSGGELRQLTPDDEREYKEGLEWHPDGQRLTYMYHAANFEGDGLRTAYLDGRPSTPFINDPSTWDYIGTWAPDGSAYYFLASDQARPGWQLYRRDAENGEILEVSAGDDLSLPCWSQDGRTMVWSVEQVRSQLWILEFEH